MAKLPTGTVTFLFTDIEGSTRLWEEHPEAMRQALVRHDTLLAGSIQQQGGVVVKSRGEGDSLFAVFAFPGEAVAAACAVQQGLFAEPWPAETPLRARVAMHTATADLREGDYYGPGVNRCARLRALAHGGQVVLSRATAEQVRDHLPAGVSLRDLGSHRLRDLLQPEQIFQLLHPALPGDFPPLRSLETYAHNLPAQLTRFIGREQEMAEAKRLLTTTRLLTLTGSGGCGKTRLALQVAADLLEEYPDGVWLAELAALADAARVPQTVAAALGVREQPGRPLTQTLTEYLRSRKLLLVVDNCEHLLTACAQLVDSLLRGCPHLRILASSREGLGIAGEQAYRVPSLSQPDAKQLPPLDRLRGYEAVQLFTDRAMLSQPTFTVTAANAGAVAEVCRRLDGIPLAIELAAARVKALPVEQIAARLDDRFRLLTGGSRAALPRQQTLRALIDWSYDLLPASERTLLERLSVFAGGWTLEATEAVCSDGGIGCWVLGVGDRASGPIPNTQHPIPTVEVLDLLSHLVEKSLVAYEEQGATGRYRLLETVRQYARDKLLDSTEIAAVRNRHRDYFLALAVEGRPEPTREAEVKAWLDRMEAEHDNLRAVLAWTLEDPEGVDASLRLASALWAFWRTRGYFREGREWLERALVRDGPRDGPRGRALNAAGIMANMMGDHESSRVLAEESLAIFRELGDKRWIAVVLVNLGTDALENGEFERARTLLEEGLALRRERGERRGVGLTLRCLGDLACALGDYAQAWALLEECLTIAREPGMPTSDLAIGLYSLSAVARRQGDFQQARSLVQESLCTLQAGRGEPDALAEFLEELARVEQAEKRLARAAALFGTSAKIREEINWTMRPLNRKEYEQCLGELRSTLGEATFAAAWEEGRRMTREQAVAYALEAGAQVDSERAEHRIPAQRVDEGGRDTDA